MSPDRVPQDVAERFRISIDCSVRELYQTEEQMHSHATLTDKLRDPPQQPQEAVGNRAPDNHLVPPVCCCRQRRYLVPAFGLGIRAVRKRNALPA